VRLVVGAKRLLPCVCTLIVAAFQVPFAAGGALFDEVPVPGGAAGLARSLSIDPVPDRARFMFEMTRLVYDSSEFRSPSAAIFLQAMRQPGKRRVAPPVASNGSDDAVPVPLGADVWSDAVFRRRVSREELVGAIIADRAAALLCHGLLRLDDETLAFFAAHSGLLLRIYERSAPVFAAFAAGIRVRDNRVVPPGDAGALPLWEAAVGEKVTRAERFITLLLEVNDGRVAYLNDIVAQLDAPHRAFVLGAWMPEAERAERFRILTTSGMGAAREWHVRVMPFGRASYDFGMCVARLAVRPDGAPVPPAGRGLWNRVVTGSDVGGDQPIDAVWIAENVGATDVRQRGERLDQLGFAQRVFGGDGDQADVAFVLRSMPRFRALLLSLERMGVRRPAVYSGVIRHASKLATFEGRRAYVAQAQLQGSLVLIARMAAVGTLDLAAAERLIDRLVALPIDGAVYAGGIARWLRDDVHPLLPPARDIESAVIAGLAGRAVEAAAVQRVTWEGQRYRLDLTASERNRLQRVREKQGATAIDVPLQLADAARTVASDTLTVEDALDAASQFSALAEAIPKKSREEEADNVPAGVAVPPPAHDILKKAVEELSRAARNKDLRRAARIAEPVVELADDLLARHMLSLAYAISLGDPDGTVLLADDVSHRHDFGIGGKDGEMRSRLTWAIPRQEVAPNVPWHVSGSLMALDVALSTLSLRRVTTDRVLEAPKLTSNARDTFASSVSLMNPLELRDADRDGIADAIGRGRRRVEAARPADLDTVVDELSIDAARARALRWTLAHDASDLESMLSMTELMMLGGARIEDFHPWGMGVVAAGGCLCSRLLPPGAWAALAGRPQLGLAAAVVPDLNFEVAIRLKELNLPAPLARVVLAAAVQDFIDEVRPTDDGDWLTLSRRARTLSRERIEDYIAAATATGPLMPDAARSPERQR
jgi:hypothetical protein